MGGHCNNKNTLRNPRTSELLVFNDRNKGNENMSTLPIVLILREKGKKTLLFIWYTIVQQRPIHDGRKEEAQGILENHFPTYAVVKPPRVGRVPEERVHARRHELVRTALLLSNHMRKVRLHLHLCRRAQRNAQQTDDNADAHNDPVLLQSTVNANGHSLLGKEVVLHPELDDTQDSRSNVVEALIHKKG